MAANDARPNRVEKIRECDSTRGLPPRCFVRKRGCLTHSLSHTVREIILFGIGARWLTSARARHRYTLCSRVSQCVPVVHTTTTTTTDEHNPSERGYSGQGSKSQIVVGLVAFRWSIYIVYALNVCARPGKTQRAKKKNLLFSQNLK